MFTSSYKVSRMKNGFTLVEVFIAVTVLVVVGAFLLRVTGAGGGESVEKEASAFAKNISPDAKVTCVDIDSDGDGYVSCTVFPPEGKPPVAIECASSYSPNNGCRIAQPVIKTRRFF
jgi:prepilin-type N-terminal cleavage/methylation domain-containing protein